MFKYLIFLCAQTIFTNALTSPTKAEDLQSQSSAISNLSIGNNSREPQSESVDNKLT